MTAADFLSFLLLPDAAAAGSTFFSGEPFSFLGCNFSFFFDLTDFTSGVSLAVDASVDAACVTCSAESSVFFSSAYLTAPCNSIRDIWLNSVDST